ncbi:MAG: aminotransferase class IV [Nitrospirae bacterium]|jgi:branched-chain amino acid aminotransferase|nr:aminotransferase class IV [Nitrospirota bacterium]
MDNLIVYNGTLLPAAEARISVFDPGFLYGESIFTTMAVRERSPCFLSRHLDRLLRTAEQTGWKNPPDRKDLTKGVHLLLQSLEILPSLLRITLSPGPLTGFRLDSRQQGPSVWMVLPVYRDPLPKLLYQSGVAVGVGPIQAFGANNPGGKIKTGNLFLSRWIRRHLPDDLFEALLRNPRGFFVEGTVSNLFWVTKDKHLLTPPETWGILPGIVRSILLETARNLRTPVRWGSLTQQSIHKARAGFLTNSFMGVLPIKAVRTDKNEIPLDPRDPLLALFATELEHRLIREISP